MADWLQKYQTQFVIVTGDGVGYLPDYLTTSVSKEIEFNVSKFEFVGVQGSLVVRREVMGAAYDMEIIFQGLNHLDTADAFEKSSENKTAWKVSHPQYGGLTVQPMSLKRDNGVDNISRFTCAVIETIGSGVTTPVVSPPDKVANDSLRINQRLAASYTNDIPVLPVSSLQGLQNNINGIYTAILGTIANVQNNVQGYRDTYNRSNTILNNATSDTLNIISAVQELVVAPALFADSVVNRIKSFQTALDILNQNLSAVENDYSKTGKDIKKLFENNAGATICGICISAVTNLDKADYDRRTQVVDVIQQLLAAYNTYLEMLDGIQTLTGGTPDSYIPDPDALVLLDGLVNYTVSSLFDIANSAKQERSYLLPEDSNVILVANKVYGLQTDDSTIDYLISTNGIVGYEVYKLQKGREILYYV